MKPFGQTGLDFLRQWLTLIAIVGTFGINVWSNIAPLNGLSIGEISNTLFAAVQIIPANYAFAIWGLIYLGLLALGIYQVLPAQRHQPMLRRVDAGLILACVAQSIWVFLFLSRQFVGSVVAMLGILLSLILAYRACHRPEQRLSRLDRWLVQIPLSIYLGWIAVATIVNVASALYSLGWMGGGLNPQIWTALMAIAGGLIAAWLLWQQRDIAYGLVTVWALIAIAVRQSDLPLIAFSAAGMALLLVVLAGLTRLRRLPFQPKSPFD